MQLIFQDPFSSLDPRMTIGAMLKQLLEFHDLAHGSSAATASASCSRWSVFPPTP